MEPTKTEKLVAAASEVNARRQTEQSAASPLPYSRDTSPYQTVGMVVAFLGIVSLPMYGWVGGLQTLAGALLMWVFYLIQDRDTQSQSATAYMLRLVELRDEFAAYRAKYGPSPEEAQEQRRAYAASLLHRS